MEEKKGQEMHLYNLRKMKLRLIHLDWMLSFNLLKKDRPPVNDEPIMDMSCKNLKLLNLNVCY